MTCQTLFTTSPKKDRSIDLPLPNLLVKRLSLLAREQCTETFNLELISFDFGVGLKCWDTVSAVNAQLWLRFITVSPTNKMFGATGKLILL